MVELKEFFSRRWLIVVLAAVLLCLVMAIFSALSGGRISPVSNLINMLATPLQKAAVLQTLKAMSHENER